jgi:hypothetical protein
LQTTTIKLVTPDVRAPSRSWLLIFFPRPPEDVCRNKTPVFAGVADIFVQSAHRVGNFVAILIDSSGTHLLLAGTNKSPSKQIKFRRLYFAALCIYLRASFRSALCPGS